jgi:hypothetical protein
MRRKKSRWAREVMQLGRGQVQSRRRALLKGSRKRARESNDRGVLAGASWVKIKERKGPGSAQIK